MFSLERHAARVVGAVRTLRAAPLPFESARLDQAAWRPMPPPERTTRHREAHDGVVQVHGLVIEPNGILPIRGPHPGRVAAQGHVSIQGRILARGVNLRSV